MNNLTYNREVMRRAIENSKIDPKIHSCCLDVLLDTIESTLKVGKEKYEQGGHFNEPILIKKEEKVCIHPKQTAKWVCDDCGAIINEGQVVAHAALSKKKEKECNCDKPVGHYDSCPAYKYPSLKDLPKLPMETAFDDDLIAQAHNTHTQVQLIIRYLAAIKDR